MPEFVIKSSSITIYFQFRQVIKHSISINSKEILNGVYFNYQPIGEQQLKLGCSLLHSTLCSYLSIHCFYPKFCFLIIEFSYIFHQLLYLFVMVILN